MVVLIFNPLNARTTVVSHRQIFLFGKLFDWMVWILCLFLRFVILYVWAFCMNVCVSVGEEGRHTHSRQSMQKGLKPLCLYSKGNMGGRSTFYRHSSFICRIRVKVSGRSLASFLYLAELVLNLQDQGLREVRILLPPHY